MSEFTVYNSQVVPKLEVENYSVPLAATCPIFSLDFNSYVHKQAS